MLDLKLDGTAALIFDDIEFWNMPAASNAPNLPASAVIYRSAFESAPSSVILFWSALSFPDTTFTLIPVFAVNFS